MRRAGGTRRTKLTAAILAGLLVAACGSSSDDAAPVDTEPATTQPIDPEPATTEPVETEPATTAPIDTEPATTAPIETEPAATEPIDPEPGEAVIEPLPLGDACEPIDPDDFEFLSLYAVVDGEITALCAGEEDPVARAAWEELVVIAPAETREPITQFGSFVAPAGEEDTLAFVTNIDDDGSTYELAVNSAEGAADEEELALTMAHELTHVFTATPDQLDRSREGDCDTYFNGQGCYLPDALLFAWIVDFWEPEVLATVNPFVDSPDDADERCSLDPSFFGAYAATNPEEDFAETFSAFVYDVPALTDAQQDKLDWMAAEPELAIMRDRAAQAGRGPLENDFDLCG